MKVGLLIVFQNFEDRISDTEAWQRDIHLAGLAEPLGFDILSGVEHHFFNYAMCPDNTQFLSYMAAKTKEIGLGCKFDKRLSFKEMALLGLLAS